MAPRAISLENHKKKGPIWGPYTRRSDRAGKTRTALLEMCTALLETRCELMTKQFCRCKILFFSKWEMKVNILRAKFTIQANCPMQNYFSRQLTPKEQKESPQSSQLKKFTTFSEANNKQTGGQENNFSEWIVR